MVSVVTRAPRCARPVASSPQPVPISSTCMSGRPGHVQDAVDLARCASASDSAGPANHADE
jgi:hypothetical protein